MIPAPNTPITQEGGWASQAMTRWMNAIRDAIAVVGGATSPLTSKGDLWGFDTADNRVPVGTDGYVLTADAASALGVKWAVSSPVDATYVTLSTNGTLTNERALTAGSGITVTDAGAGSTVTVAVTGGVTHVVRAAYGDGSDGTVTFDGSTAVAGCTRSGSVYTMTRSVQYVNATIQNGVTVKPANAGVIACTGTLTVEAGGIIDLNGNAASGGVAGAGVTAGHYGTGTAGGSGSGSGGGASSAPAIGGAGGAGGLNAGGGGTGGGGSGGAANAPAISDGSWWFVKQLQAFLSGRSAAASRFNGGGGGGAGTNGGSGTPGAGGAGGLVGGVFAKTLAGSGTIRANGGAGGNASGGLSNAGGGGGGGGGAIFIITQTSNYASTLTVTANGGAGGNPVGTGNYGAQGSSGNIYEWIDV